MTTSPDGEITRLFAAAAAGNPSASQQLLAALYDELHRLAALAMARERPNHTLQPTALLNEAYLKLFPPGSANYTSREHFFAVAAVVMRRLLVNHALARGAQKRGGSAERLPLDPLASEFESQALDLLALEQALQQLAELDPQQARIVELRFFGGMSVDDCAVVMGVSPRTVKYEWAHARAWLRHQLSGE